jgi:hypothetical protein
LIGQGTGCPVPSINSSALKNLLFFNTVRLDDFFDQATNENPPKEKRV